MTHILLLAVVAAIPLGSSCMFADSRVGVGTGPALVYKNVTTPMSLGGRRGERPRSLEITGPLETHSITAHRIGLDIPFVLPPGVGDALSVGWGDMSNQKLFRESGFENVLFADGNELSILGLYTRSKIIWYSHAEVVE